MPTQTTSQTTADFCRANGWGPGTCLRGINVVTGHGDNTIRINALGTASILATAIAQQGVPTLPKYRHERCWTLTGRDWVEVPDPEQGESQ